MATKTSTQNLSNLVINRVTSPTAFKQMVSAGQINTNELYLVEETPYYFQFTASNWSSRAITVTASTHNCGTAPMVQVQVLNGTSYEMYYGYPSNGWKVSINASGDVTLSVSASGMEFAGRLVIR